MRDAGWPLNVTLSAFAALALLAVGLMAMVARSISGPSMHPGTGNHSNP